MDLGVWGVVMKKILYSEMSSLGSAMESLLQNPVIRSGMKKSTLFKFWDKVVGKKFEGHTKISSLNSIGNKTVLVVACGALDLRRGPQGPALVPSLIRSRIFA